MEKAQYYGSGCGQHSTVCVLREQHSPGMDGLSIEGGGGSIEPPG